MLLSRPTAGRALVTGLLAVVAAAGVAGCSTVDKVQTAAIVDGDRITTSDVSDATTEYNSYLRGTGAAITEPQMVGQLVQAHFVLAWIKANGGFKPDATYARVLGTVPDASQSTKDFVASQLAVSGGSLTPQATTAILAGAAKAKVELNPRYGAFDPKTVSIAPSTPNWIKPGRPDPAATAPATPQQ